MPCVLILIEYVHGSIYRLQNDLSNSAHQFIENESDTKIFRIEK